MRLWPQDPFKKYTYKDVGTVPYHRDMAAMWRRHWWVGASILMVLNSIYAFLPTHWWEIRFMDGILLVINARALYNAQRHRREHLVKAWQAEAVTTFAGLKASGLYTDREALAVTRDGPMPPGMRRKAWIKMHDEFVLDLEDQGTLPEDGQ